MSGKRRMIVVKYISSPLVRRSTTSGASLKNSCRVDVGVRSIIDHPAPLCSGTCKWIQYRGRLCKRHKDNILRKNPNNAPNYWSRHYIVEPFEKTYPPPCAGCEHTENPTR